MGYFDQIVTPVGTQKKKGGYFDQITLPANQERANNIFRLQEEAIKAERERQEAQSISGFAKNFAADLGNKVVKVPIDFVKSTWDIYGQAGERVGKTTKDTFSEINRAATAPGLNPLQRVDNVKTALTKGTFRNAGDLVIGVFAPVSAAVGAVLNMTGGSKLIDDTGNTIADKSGITDIPAFQKFALEHPDAGLDFERLLNLATLGGAKKATSKEIATQAEMVATKIVESQSGTRKVPVEGRSVETPVEFANRYTPDGELPVIPAGTRPKGSLPEIQTEVSSSRTGSFTYEPIPQSGGYFDRITTPDSPAQTTSARTLPARETAPAPRTPVLEGEAVSIRSKKLLDAATARGLIDDAGEVPTHQVKNMADDLGRAESLIQRDRTLAEDIAMGDTLARDVEAGSVYKALEIQAIQSGDIALIQKLARSKVPTEAGRALKALDSVDPNSPVRIIRDINAARETKIEKRMGQKPEKLKVEEAKTIDSEITKAYSKRPQWDEFIEQITCGY